MEELDIDLIYMEQQEDQLGKGVTLFTSNDDNREARTYNERAIRLYRDTDCKAADYWAAKVRFPTNEIDEGWTRVREYVTATFEESNYLTHHGHLLDREPPPGMESRTIAEDREGTVKVKASVNNEDTYPTLTTDPIPDTVPKKTIDKIADFGFIEAWIGGNVVGGAVSSVAGIASLDPTVFTATMVAWLASSPTNDYLEKRKKRQFEAANVFAQEDLIERLKEPINELNKTRRKNVASEEPFASYIDSDERPSYDIDEDDLTKLWQGFTEQQFDRFENMDGLVIEYLTDSYKDAAAFAAELVHDDAVEGLPQQPPSIYSDPGAFSSIMDTLVLDDERVFEDAYRLVRNAMDQQADEAVIREIEEQYTGILEEVGESFLYGTVTSETSQ